MRDKVLNINDICNDICILEQIAELESKLEALKTDKMKAERQSNDATTKLNVLSNYFKEKEAQLQK